MAVRVYIPTPYRALADKLAHVEVQAISVVGVLTELSRRYPGLRDRILADDGKVPGHLNVYVNQVEVRTLDGADTAVKDGDEVALIPAMAGGSPDPTPPPAPVTAAAPSAAAAAPAPPAAAPSAPSATAAAPPPAKPLLNREQLERYSRHVRLDEVGVAGQRRLLDSKVLLIGAGGLGSPAAVYLAAAGVGTLGIVDGDRVDLSNLQRQILHFNHDVGRPKVQSARRHIEDLNPDVQVRAFPTVIDSSNAMDIVKDFDVVINGSDNFPTRYLINDTCVLLGKPLVDASILKWDGQMTVFLPGRGCYRCLFPVPPPPGSVPSCAEGGIIGALCGHMGTLQAIEAIKLLLHVGEPLSGRLLTYDALSGEYLALRWNRNPECPICGDQPTIHELIDYEGFCGVPGPAHDGRHENAREVAETPAAADVATDVLELTPRQAYARIAAGALIIDVREPYEFEQAHIAGAELMPMSVFAQRARQVLDPLAEMVFVCRIGERSRLAARMLRDAGFAHAHNLQDGMVGWVNEGLPVDAPARVARGS